MHLKKFQGSACGNMTRHYERNWHEGFERDNVDATRTHLNFNCCTRAEKPMNAIKQAVSHHNAISARKLRKDAVRMADIVVTLPQNVPECDLEQFFQSTTEFLLERTGGAENCLGAFVHMDESQPHMHFSFMPLVDEKFNAKKMLNREFFQSLHGDLQEYLTPILGYVPQVKDSERIMPYVELKDVDKMKKIEQQLKELQGKAPNPEKLKQLYVLKGTLEAGGGGLFSKGKNEKALEQVNKMIEQEEKAHTQVKEVKAEQTVKKETSKDMPQEVPAKAVEKPKLAQNQVQEVHQQRRGSSLKERAANAQKVSEALENTSHTGRRYR